MNHRANIVTDHMRPQTYYTPLEFLADLEGIYRLASIGYPMTPDCVAAHHKGNRQEHWRRVADFLNQHWPLLHDAQIVPEKWDCGAIGGQLGLAYYNLMLKPHAVPEPPSIDRLILMVKASDLNVSSLASHYALGSYSLNDFSEHLRIMPAVLQYEEATLYRKDAPQAIWNVGRSIAPWAIFGRAYDYLMQHSADANMVLANAWRLTWACAAILQHGAKLLDAGLLTSFDLRGRRWGAMAPKLLVRLHDLFGAAESVAACPDRVKCDDLIASPS